MERLSSRDEELLLAGVKKAVDLVDNHSYSPNDALFKIAKDLGYTPGFLKAACSAFNTGRQLAQWESNSSVLDKLADFPLADYSTLHDRIWGTTKEKVASCDSPVKFRSYKDYQASSLLNLELSTREKVASVVESEPELTVKRAFDNKDYQTRLLEVAKQEKFAAENLLNYNLHLLVSYFQKSAYDRLPLAQVEHAAGIYFGKPGAELLNYVASQFPSEKRASDHKSTWSGFHAEVKRNAEPYTLIEVCIKQAAALAVAESKLTAAITAARKAEKAANDLYAKISPPVTQKEANLGNILGGVAGGFGMGAAKNLGESVAEGGQSALENEIKNLDSPEHLNELRKIRAQTALTQMMSDPENPISEYDPDQVLSAYNDLVQLSPRIADQPAAIGPLLRKRLMGNVEPFELAETLKLEEGLKRTQSSNLPNVMRNEASILS
jgi:hypothetical protein